MRRAARKDDAHKIIVEGLEQFGIVVFDVSPLAGLGFDIVCYKGGAPLNYDLLTGAIRTGCWQCFEIKNPEPQTRTYQSSKRKLQPKETRQLTASEVKARTRAPIPIVRTLEEALSYF